MPGLTGKQANSSVSRLVEDLAPVTVRSRTYGLTIGWLLGGWGVIASSVLTLGPLRPGAIDQLGSSPQFLMENLLGLLSGTLLAAVGFRLCIPGSGGPLRSPWILVVPLAWLGACLFAWVSPALPSTMLGKRPGCELQVLALGATMLCIALFHARRLASLHPITTGACLGAAAGAIPGLMMQLACMYEASHTLAFHLGPIGLLALVGALLGRRLLNAI